MPANHMQPRLLLMADAERVPYLVIPFTSVYQWWVTEGATLKKPRHRCPVGDESPEQPNGQPKGVHGTEDHMMCHIFATLNMKWLWRPKLKPFRGRISLPILPIAS